ncbi:hypothetical protein SAMN05216188_1029 [Lentzea xinjiangensis]|uniref:Uncharacterized protein n=1 Tax=Lentzea xinjiangensis TaxID=402600 RepID=A0A1H9D4X4_9PSEU|nr:hypothetical protein [Lentzea xinjiangensis]SEQ08526.1 hypothetical protein SAMN05216188_1029 [Lentzea xinjiangensis]
MQLRPKKLTGLTRLASYVMDTRGVFTGYRPVDRRKWLDGGTPAQVVQRAVDFQQRWGGLALPPVPAYDGGPVVLGAGHPATAPSGDWYFEAGAVHVAVPFDFVVEPGGEFAIATHEWTALHTTVEGWVESVALAHYASWAARRITQLRGAEVDALDLDGFEPVPAVRGAADTWWRGPDSVVAVWRGEADLLGDPGLSAARVHEGVTLDGWDL